MNLVAKGRVMNKLVQRVARAIANEQGGWQGAPPRPDVLAALKEDEGQERYDEVMLLARAAIEAMREPTKAMVTAVAGDADPSMSDEWDASDEAGCWRAMIDAALKDV